MMISTRNEFSLNWNRLFTAYPETQKMFPRIADVPVSELMSNRKFLSISYSAFAGFNFILNNMDDPEIIKLQLSKVDFPGMFVFPFPGTSQQHQVRTHLVIAITQQGKERHSKFYFCPRILLASYWKCSGKSWAPPSPPKPPLDGLLC